jgi:hypothetical protein
MVDVIVGAVLAFCVWCRPLQRKPGRANSAHNSGTQICVARMVAYGVKCWQLKPEAWLLRGILILAVVGCVIGRFLSADTADSIQTANPTANSSKAAQLGSVPWCRACSMSIVPLLRHR